MIQQMKIAPHFFLGLGGCGSQIVNEIARKLKRRDEEYRRYQDLVHFFVLDTDQHELKRCESADVRVPLSDFDKRAFVGHSFGQRGAPEDPTLASWWPDYYLPRDVAGAGAGQIRIESRLSLFFTLRHRPQVLTSFEQAIGAAFGRDVRYRDQEKFPMVHVFASLAGGTGSGAFLPIAYLMQDLLRDFRRPIVVGTFVLPAIFKRVGLPSQQLDKIMANGYSALQELEHLQGASDEEPVDFQYDPRAKELQTVRRRAFDQVYLVDDVGELREVISDARLAYQAIADSAYAQVFSDILGRQASTADNDEREMGVTDVQRYTKRYGSFGLSVLNVPDDDILEYCAHRFAVEALTRTFALPESHERIPPGQEDRERRDQQFVRSVEREARIPGESGKYYQRILDWSDGGEHEQGSVDRFLRLFGTEFEPRIGKHLEGLPRWTEDKLLEYDEQPDMVRTEMPKRLESWQKFAAKARDAIDEETSRIAQEVAGNAHEHSFAKITGDRGPIAERLFLIRLAARLREMQARARGEEAAAEQTLRAVPPAHEQWVERLVESAPKKLTEFLRGNDYGREVVPEFIGWYRSHMEGPQIGYLKSFALVDLCDGLLKIVDRRRDDLGTLFGELIDIRGKLSSACEELRKFGRRRELGGEATENVLDVEVYQNYEDPDPFRMWHWVFETREQPGGDYDPAQIFPAIQAAYAGVKHARHMSQAVIDALVQMGSVRWRERVIGKDEPQSLDQAGLQMVDALPEEARLALTWRRLRKRYLDPTKVGPARTRDEWELAAEHVTAEGIDEYLRHKIAYAAKKCAPFVRIQREEGATRIEAKRYVTVYPPYLDDPSLREALTHNERFPVKDADVLASDDPKRVVFYWSELGVPVYRFASMDEYYDRYHHVKREELSRGRVWRWQDLPLRSGISASRVRSEGKRIPDIPLHIDKRWEGAPDERDCLADVAPQPVFSGKGKSAWLEERARANAEGELLQRLVLARCFGLLGLGSDGQWRFSNDKINEDDRTLGKFRDRALARFRELKPGIVEWLDREIGARCRALEESRDKQGARDLIGRHADSLRDELLNLEGDERSMAQQELEAAGQALEGLLRRM